MKRHAVNYCPILDAHYCEAIAVHRTAYLYMGTARPGIMNDFGSVIVSMGGIFIRE